MGGAGVAAVSVSVCQCRMGFPKKWGVACQAHFRWLEAAKGKNKAIKPLDEKTGEYFHGFGGETAFLSRT